MSNKYAKGAEWRRWDLHIHTKDTFKNDLFKSNDFNSFCDVLFQKALSKDIAVIGITDYFSIANYKKVVTYLSTIDTNPLFDFEQRAKIKSILIIPNVELRVLPVTDSGRLVNFHCLFNPDYVVNAEDDFFNSLHMSIGDDDYHMNESGLKKLGLKKGATEDNAVQKGIESFVVSPSDLVNLFKKKPLLRKNTITIVSNSNKDGNSAYQKHYDFFEEIDKTSLEEIRKSIYHLSDFIFSSNKNDREYFLGRKKNPLGKVVDDEKIVITKCGSLKGCVHGSDAHTEEDLFMPNNDLFCWFKADPTSDGLKEALIEPEDRIFVGKTPPIHERVTNNRTKYIKALKINAIAGYNGRYGKWFDNTIIEFNNELVAIIGNKGSGKSAIADIVGLCANYKNHKDFSFLHPDKFRKGNLSKNFQASIVWESDVQTNSIILSENPSQGQIEQVKYLPQGYFERLTNEINTTEAFQKEIQDVVFNYLEDEDKVGFDSFDALIEFHKANVEKEIQNLNEGLASLNSTIIKLEQKLNPVYKNEVKNKLKQKQDELLALIEPEEVKNPSEDQGVSEANNLILLEIQRLKGVIAITEEEIARLQNEKNSLLLELKDLKELKQDIDFKVNELKAFKEAKKEIMLKHGLDVDVLLDFKSDLTSLSTLILKKEERLQEIKKTLGDVLSEKDFQSLKDVLEGYNKKLAEEQAKLDSSQRFYQIYLSDKKSWEDRKNKIIGSKIAPDTIKFYENELSNLENYLLNDIEVQRNNRLEVSMKIFDKKQEVISVYKQVKSKLDSIINDNAALLQSYRININANLTFSNRFPEVFFRNINQNQSGTFYSIEGGNVEFNKLKKDVDFDKREEVELFLKSIIDALFYDLREKQNREARFLEGQIKNSLELYNSLYSLSFLEYNYELMQGTKKLQQLSPGERGALLLVFYLLLDKSDIPLIIDQPEDNLDNNSVARILVPFMRNAKTKRQIILVTHNPNLAVVADAEQVIYVNIDKENDYEFQFESGSIENRRINDCIVKVLEGEMPAFNKRKLKYYEPTI